MQHLQYQRGFGNIHWSQAIAGVLPEGHNSPQTVKFGLYPEQISGSSFTAQRSENWRTWVYRILPTVALTQKGMVLDNEIYHWGKSAEAGKTIAINPERWFPPKFSPLLFPSALVTNVVNGTPEAGYGAQIGWYHLKEGPSSRALCNTDGEMLFLPQEGAVLVETELGRLWVPERHLVVIPRGILFRLSSPRPARGYFCENYGAPFRLPSLGLIGSNGLANPQDFFVPTAWYAADGDENSPVATLVTKSQGAFFEAPFVHSPWNVVAWHGNYTPYLYPLERFQVLGSISFDHPDPSLFTVLTSPSLAPGYANLDLVLFSRRWLVALDTFRPPYFHRNRMSEWMGLLEGTYDAKEEGFVPLGASLHNAMNIAKSSLVLQMLQCSPLLLLS